MQGSHQHWKIWEMGLVFPVKEKSWKFENVQKSQTFMSQYWKINGYMKFKKFRVFLPWTDSYENGSEWQ